MKCMIEFFNIPQQDAEYLINPIDDSEYQRVLDDVVTALKDGDYSIEVVE